MSKRSPAIVTVLFVLMTGLLVWQSWRVGTVEQRAIVEAERAETNLHELKRCAAGFGEYAEKFRACMMFGNLRPATFETDFFGLRYFGDASKTIDYHVLRYGAYEKPLIYFLRDVARRIKDGQGSWPTVLDVGANVGHHSLFMSRFAQTVVAVEPLPPVLAVFRRMVEANKLTNVRIVPVALGARKERLRFQPSVEDPTTGGSFATAQEPGAAASLPEFDVVTGDQMLAEMGIDRVELIKMDIEGFEKPALEGLRATLERDRPVLLVEVTFDVGKPVLFKSFAEFLGALPAQYQVRQVFYSYDDLETGQYKLSAVPATPGTVAQWNLVAYPEQKATLVDVVPH